MIRIFNNKGITIVESLIAVFLTAVAVASLISMQPLSWQSAGKADSISRAVGILQQELETAEVLIKNGTPPSDSADYDDVFVGNQRFEKRLRLSQPNTSSWLVNVHVRWQGNPKGIQSSMIVMR